MREYIDGLIKLYYFFREYYLYQIHYYSIVDIFTDKKIMSLVGFYIGIDVI